MPESKKMNVTLTAAIIVAVGAIVAAIITGLLSKPSESPNITSKPIGKIFRPKEGETVARGFDVSGTLENIPADHQVWLAVKIGNLLWPKEPMILSSDRRWSIRVVEGGSPGVFSISLLLVSKKGQKVIKNWLENGRRTGNYPGMDKIAGSSCLDIVENLRLQ